MMISEKEQFLMTWDRECATTIKLLKAYPLDRQDYRPNEKIKTAKELAWLFTSEAKVAMPGAIVGNIDFSKMEKPPETMKEAVEEFEKLSKEVNHQVKKTADDELNKTMKFYVAPKTMGDVRRMDMLWMFLMDQIHHRGQFSIYLRLVGAKVPSIYGPSADEPWN
jgi:uncharacterized damage-inducible protein DinB